MLGETQCLRDVLKLRFSVDLRFFRSEILFTGLIFEVAYFIFLKRHGAQCTCSAREALNVNRFGTTVAQMKKV